MLRRIIGTVAVLWGAGILISNLLMGDSYPSNEKTYNAREVAIVVIGVLLLLIGMYYLIKGTHDKGKLR